MPCKSDYLDPTDREKELQRAAILFRFVLTELKRAVPHYVNGTADDVYAARDYIPDLCRVMKALPEKERERLQTIRKDKANPQRRRLSLDLSLWVLEHEEADREREAAEEREKAAREHRKSGLAKLSKAEKKALGL